MSSYNLFLAAEDNNYNMIPSLILAGCNVDEKDKRNRTALSIATEKDHYTFAEKLVRLGAYISSYDFCTAASRETLSFLALYFQRCPYLLNCVDNFGNTPLITAVIFNRHENVKFLLGKGADVNKHSVSRNGRCALHFAVVQNLEITRILVEKGFAKLDVTDHNKRTPLDYADQEDIRNYLKTKLL